MEKRLAADLYRSLFKAGRRGNLCDEVAKLGLVIQDVGDVCPTRARSAVELTIDILYCAPAAMLATPVGSHDLWWPLATVNTTLYL